MSDKPMVDDMLPEYDIDYSKARTNRFAACSNPTRLAQECANLDACEEQALAEEGLTAAGLSELSQRRFPAASHSGKGRAVTVEVAIEKDILAWFQAQGQDYPQRMRAAMRLYAEAHRASVQ